MKKAIFLFAMLWAALGTAAETKEKKVILAGAAAGVSLPQINSELGTTFSINLELGYFLPVWRGRLGLITSLGYSQPTASGTGEDARLPEGQYSWEITQKILAWNIAAAVHVMPAESPWNLTIVLGPRVVFLKQLTDGQADGEPFGEHSEQATRPGLLLAFGGSYRLGPGALCAKLALPMTFENLRTSGEVNVIQLEILLGYRFLFSF